MKSPNATGSEGVACHANITIMCYNIAILCISTKVKTMCHATVA